MKGEFKGLVTGKSLPAASAFLKIYGSVRSEMFQSRLRRLIVRWEGGAASSETIRKILFRHHGLEIGLFSTWPWRVKPGVFHRGTKVGRYCSIAETVRTYTRNHPFNLRSTHGLFYNPALGMVKGPPVKFGELHIGNGVRMGHNVIVLPPASRIGDGAVIAAGSVVCTNIPPYAKVTGFPASVVGYRFEKNQIAELLSSRWWERNPSELASDRRTFQALVTAINDESSG